MRNRKLALRYARALLEALPDPGEQEAADEFLTALAGAMGRDARLRDRLLDPAIAREARISALVALVRAHGLPRQVENFLRAVVDHGRTGDLPVIAAEYRGARQRAQGIVSATLVTAGPLGEELTLRARRALERLSGRQVSLQCEVEPGLIGGAVARVGSTVYDGSLRNQLARLRQKMAEE
jgi:F-type H+-transporting ATPase subunit delta